MRTLIAVAIIGTLSACTSPGEVDGSVDGHELEVTSAVFAPISGTETIMLSLSEADDACEDVRTRTSRKNAGSMWFMIAKHDGATDPSALPLTAGEYTLVPFHGIFELDSDPPPQFALGNFYKSDNQCDSVISSARHNIRSGTIRIETITRGKDVKGTFDVRVGEQGDRLTGSFDATHCEIPEDRPGAESCK